MKPAKSSSSSRRRFFRRSIGVGGALVASSNLPASSAVPPSNAVLQTIHGLRSIHGNFSQQRVPDDKVEAVLDASVRAANASNMQSYSIVVSRDPAKIQKLTTYRANCLLLYCCDYTRLTDTAKYLGHDFFADNVDSFITSSTNAILAAQTAVIAARSLGIESLLTNGIHRGDINRLWEILELPSAGCIPLIALLLGYPQSEPSHRMGRLRGPGLVHYERYHRLEKSELEDIVQKHDDPAAGLALNEEWRKKGHKHYLDWFYKEWVTGRKATSIEGPMLRRLRQAGFIDGDSLRKS